MVDCKINFHGLFFYVCFKREKHEVRERIALIFRKLIKSIVKSEKILHSFST